MTKRQKLNFARYRKETYKNKICAFVLFLCGLFPAMIDGDGTALLFLGCISIPLFFAKKNWIML